MHPKQIFISLSFLLLLSAGLSCAGLENAAPPLMEQAELLTGCIAGAEHIDRIRDLLDAVGFNQVKIELKPYSKELVSGWFPGSGAENYVASADIEAVKSL